jgi:hypothetical protein
MQLRTRQTLGLSTSWALLLALTRRFGCQATTSMILPPGVPPPPYTLKHLHAALLQDYDCTGQPAADLPELQSDAVGSVAANAGAPPPPQSTRSQDTGSGTLVLPQLNSLHEAYTRRQVAPPVSSSSQDQQPIRLAPSSRNSVSRSNSLNTGPNSRSCVRGTLARGSRSSVSCTCLRSTKPLSLILLFIWR